MTNQSNTPLIFHLKRTLKAITSVLAVSTLSATASVSAKPYYLNDKEKLGKELFFDTNLSRPAGQSCASCHDPKTAFTDADKSFPASKGATPKFRGNRNAPTLLYAKFSPRFHYDTKEKTYIGGQFLDGRAATLEEQAKGPFLNPIEMGNPNLETVVNKVLKAKYARLFERVYGDDAFYEPATAYDHIADAIAAFERTPLFSPFSSKYDYFLAGKANLTTEEEHGRQLFEDKNKGNCAACHTSKPLKDGTPPLFTDFSYDNLGIPRNPNNAFYTLPSRFNPEGRGFIDNGLGAITHSATEAGYFKVPTLRNISLTGPYLHNGYFKTLEGVVDFYSSRDTKRVCKTLLITEAKAIKQGCWPIPEIFENENSDELGELKLNKTEMKNIIAFLNTLTDGYTPPK